MVDKDVLWNQVMSRKYEVEEGGWYIREGREGFGVGLWKEIRNEGSRLSNYIVFYVGNGRRIRFWLDSWCGDEALCNSFPSLFALVVSKEEWVAEVWDPLVFIDWEVVLVERLLMTIQSKRVSAEMEDKVIWKKTKNRFFSQLSLFIVLRSLKVQSGFQEK